MLQDPRNTTRIALRSSHETGCQIQLPSTQQEQQEEPLQQIGYGV
jgi:hypothetical protein